MPRPCLLCARIIDSTLHCCACVEGRTLGAVIAKLRPPRRASCSACSGNMCRIIPPSLPPLMYKWLHHVALLSVHPGRAGVPLKAAAASQDSLGAWGSCWAGWHLYSLAARQHILHNLHGAGAIFAGRRGGQQQQARQGLQRRSCRPLAGHPHTLLERQRAAQRSPCACESPVNSLFSVRSQAALQKPDSVVLYRCPVHSLHPATD